MIPLTSQPALSSFFVCLCILTLISSNTLIADDHIDTSQSIQTDPTPKTQVAKNQTASTAQHTDPLDRLFNTRKDRKFIDAIRNSNKSLIKKEPPRIIKSIPADLYVKGVVLRRDGKHTVWSQNDNNLHTPTLESSLVDQRNIWKNGSVKLHYNKQAFRLRPGQVWSTKESSIKERYLFTPTETPTQASVASDKRGEHGESTDSPSTESSLKKQPKKDLIEQAKEIRTLTRSINTQTP